MSLPHVYIADTTSLTADLYDPDTVVDLLYPREADPRAHRIASLARKKVGISARPSVLDSEKLPARELKSPDDSVISWGRRVISRLCDNDITPNDIGFLSVSYNVAGPTDMIPNIASRLCMDLGVGADIPPQEIPFHGCASGVYSLHAAAEYCRRSRKAAAVFTFDQCSWLMDRVPDHNHPRFKNSLKTNLLFGDGAAGLLVIPESMKERFSHGSLMRVENIIPAHRPGDLISIENGDFLLSGKLPHVMPEIVRNDVIQPLLSGCDLTASDVDEWSVHQGGLPILKGFVGDGPYMLSNRQISVSSDYFRRFGNLSSASSLLVLDHFFHRKRHADFGALVSFGAGYYLGGMLYRWV